MNGFGGARSDRRGGRRASMWDGHGPTGDDPLMEAGTQAERAIDGDPEALRALWESHRRWVAAVALAHLPRGVELEDVLQDVAMKVVRQIHKVRDPAMVRPWLRSVAANAARTAGRKRGARLRLTERAVERGLATPTDAAPASTGDRAQERTSAAEDARRALEAAQRLRPEYREPLLMQCVRGMSYRQIADALGVPVTTVETRLARARRMLREEIERHGGGVHEGATR